jgi:probable phosphoglycerate mutase
MARVWFVRHGETSWNAAHRLQGISDVRLSDRGRAQAERLRLQLSRRSFDTVWSSDLSRARETAEIIWGEPIVDRRLRELNFGDLDGLTWMDLDTGTREALIEFDSFVAPKGESVAAMRVRITSFLDDLPDGDHLVVTHGGVVRLVSNLCGDPIYPRPCGIVGVDWSVRGLLEPPS